MLVRPMTKRDHPAAKALHLASWRTAYVGYLPDDFLKEPVAEYMDHVWSKPMAAPDAGWVAIEDGEVIGFAVVRTRNADGPLLENLHVSPNLRGGGVGRALIVALASQLSADGYDQLWLTVLAANTRARSAYVRWGGVESDPFTDQVGGHSVPVVAVRWDNLDRLLEGAAPCR